MIDNSSEKIAENAQGSSERLCLISLMDESTIKDPKSLGAQASSLLLISPDTKAPIAETKAPIIAETKSDLTQPNNPFQVKFLLSRGLSKDNYVIDDVQRRGGNLNHYVNYNLIAGLLRNMSESRRSAITCDTTTPALELIHSRP